MTDQDLHSSEYVTIHIDGQLFGLPILKVQDVFSPERITRVPLSRPCIAGVLNLRGKIVTVVDLREILSLSPSDTSLPMMAVGVDHKSESFGLLIDKVGEVVRLFPQDIEANPVNMNKAWTPVSDGVYKLNTELMVILNVEKLINSLILENAA